ncbi:hypothetical protein HD554DRAFT_2204886 [Boletus coccyginus]|nr:hypothetical protein HD554DRAFT_2204886 [Boletus coccyginus]
MELPTRSMPAYTGCGCTSIYRRKCSLQEAARNNEKITKFFRPQAHLQTSSPNTSLSPSPSVSISSSSFKSGSVPNFPLESRTLSLDQSFDLPTSDDTTTGDNPLFPSTENGSNDASIPATAFLDMVGDDDDVELHVEPVLETIQKLKHKANKYKSFTSLFLLNALTQFIKFDVVTASIGKGKYMVQKIQAIYSYVERFRTLPLVGKGKHHAYPLLLNNEHIMAAVCQYLTVLADGEITSLLLMKQVNEVIILGLGLRTRGEQISESTTHRWLTKLGYELKEVKKGIYVDGHEHEDVVTYRNKFLSDFGKNERYLTMTMSDDDLEPIEPQLGSGKKVHVPVFHDECIFRANDLCHWVYVHDGRMPLRKKVQASQIEENTQLPVTEQLQVTDAWEIIYPGKHHDGFWTNDKLIKRTIPIFEQMYPDAVAEFVFDQSSAYGAFAKDALNAKDMNIRPGAHQTMVFALNLPKDHPDYGFHGQAKEIYHMLEERSLISVLEQANEGKVVGECRTCKLSHEAQERLHREVQEVADAGEEPVEELGRDIIIIEQAGHKCWFLPKFHCELNLIEMYWGWAKACFWVVVDSTFPTVHCLIPEILGNCPIKTIQGFFWKSWHYMDAYRKGLSAKQAEYAVKKYKSHHCCTLTIMMSVSILLN